MLAEWAEQRTELHLPSEIPRLASQPPRYPNAGVLVADFRSTPRNCLPRKLNKEAQCPCQLALL